MSDVLTGLIAASAVAVVINLPMLRAIVTTDEWRYPDIVRESSDEAFYLARIREAADGHPFVGHPAVFERRDQIYPLGQLFEWLTGTAMRLLNMRLKTVSLTADLLLPFLLSFLLWMALRPILPARRWRMLLIAILFLQAAIPWWKRPISPQAVTLLPMLYLWAILTPKRASLQLGIVRSSLIGLMLYSYPYHWTYCLATEALLTTGELWHMHSWKERLQRLAVFLLPLGIVAVPYTIFSISVAGDPAYADVLRRLGMLTSHLPTGPKWQASLLAVSVLLLLVAHRGKRTDVLVAFLPLLGAGFIVLNQTVLTGKEAEFATHYGRFLLFPLWIGFLTAVSLMLKHHPAADRTAAYGGLAAVLLSTAFVTRMECAAFQAATPPPQTRVERARIFDALQELEGEQVILTDGIFAQDLTLYTRHYPFFSHQTHMYLMPDRDVERRAGVQRVLIPDEHLDPRAVYGSSYLNKALNARARCRVRSLFGIAKNCDVDPLAFLPESWPAIRDGKASTENEILHTLKDARVSYALLRSIPPPLASHAALLADFGDYRLFAIHF